MTPPDLNSLVEDHAESLVRAARAIGFSQADAEELAQDTLVAFLKNPTQFEGRSKLSTYLFGILYNKGREMRRDRDRERPEEQIDKIFDAHFSVDDHWSDPGRKFELDQVARFIQECLGRLTLPLRTAFRLKEVDGESTDVVCEMMGLKPNHLGVLLFRARNQLRECLKSKENNVEAI